MAIVTNIDLKARTVATGTADTADITDHAVTPSKISLLLLQTGSVDISDITDTDTSVDVSFPSGFDTVPHVIFTPVLDGEDPHVRWWVSDITTTGCTIHAVLDSGTIASGSLQWVAIGGES